METITLNNIPLFFCNVNKEMGLTGHCHHADLSITFETLTSVGYPSFKKTNDFVRKHVQSLPLKGFKGTNEDVAAAIFGHLVLMDLDIFDEYVGKFRVYKIKLNVYSHEDENNHDNGYTTYKVTAPKYSRKEYKLIAEYNENFRERIPQMRLADYLTDIKLLIYATN